MPLNMNNADAQHDHLAAQLQPYLMQKLSNVDYLVPSLVDIYANTVNTIDSHKQPHQTVFYYADDGCINNYHEWPVVTQFEHQVEQWTHQMDIAMTVAQIKMYQQNVDTHNLRELFNDMYTDVLSPKRTRVNQKRYQAWCASVNNLQYDWQHHLHHVPVNNFERYLTNKALDCRDLMNDIIRNGEPFPF